MEFSSQGYWSGLPFPSPGDLTDPGIEPHSPVLQVDSLPSKPPGKPIFTQFMRPDTMLTDVKDEMGMGWCIEQQEESKNFQSIGFFKSAYLTLHIRLWSVPGSYKELFRTPKPASFLWVKLGHILEPPLFLPQSLCTCSCLCLEHSSCHSGLSPSQDPPAHCLLMCLFPLLPLLLLDISVFNCYRLNFRIPDSIMMSSVLDKHLVSLGHDYVPDLTMVNTQWLLLSA